MEKWLGQDVPKLGFGLMRLPMLPDGEVDMAQVLRMVDTFLEKGFTYFDTAYGYLNEQSEAVVRQALVERYPRDRFLLSTKLPLWHLKEEGDAERLFATQLARTGAGYFDFYLLHSLNAGYLEVLERLDIFAFMRAKKAAGLARRIGFSFHDTPEVLDRVLSEHPEFEFVLLQINYADWEDEQVQARRCYETALRHGKSVLIMEPVKGGSLATLSESAREVLVGARPDASVASWAIRFAASLDHVITVLSGMSTLGQVEDNLRTFSPFEPLTDSDRAALDRVTRILRETPTTPCTDCKYCIEECPQNIPIPGILRADNHRRVYGNVNRGQYAWLTRDKGKASDCIACGVCEGRCPQRIGIMDLMKECAALFEA